MFTLQNVYTYFIENRVFDMTNWGLRENPQFNEAGAI